LVAYEGHIPKQVGVEIHRHGAVCSACSHRHEIPCDDKGASIAAPNRRTRALQDNEIIIAVAIDVDGEHRAHNASALRTRNRLRLQAPCADGEDLSLIPRNHHNPSPFGPLAYGHGALRRNLRRVALRGRVGSATAADVDLGDDVCAAEVKVLLLQRDRHPLAVSLQYESAASRRARIDSEARFAEPFEGIALTKLPTGGFEIPEPQANAIDIGGNRHCAHV